MAYSHKRETNARRKPRAALVAGPVAFLATASVVTLGVLAGQPETRDLVATREAASTTSADITDRAQGVSRSSSRRDGAALQRAFDVNMSRTATFKAVRAADTRLWTTAPLNLWTAPGDAAKQVGELKATVRVLVTGREAGGRQEVVVDGLSRWVTSGYLAQEKPVTAAGGLSMSPCPDGGVESGLTANAVHVYRSVCHAFPQITSYGGWDAHGEHSSGRALDIMTSDKALGDQIAAFLQSHSAELNLYDVIWWDRIWTPVRASEGWRSYGDRGSATANHMDHVHVSTY